MLLEIHSHSEQMPKCHQAESWYSNLVSNYENLYSPIMVDNSVKYIQ